MSTTKGFGQCGLLRATQIPQATSVVFFFPSSLPFNLFSPTKKKNVTCSIVLITAMRLIIHIPRVNNPQRQNLRQSGTHCFIHSSLGQCLMKGGKRGGKTDGTRVTNARRLRPDQWNATNRHRHAPTSHSTVSHLPAGAQAVSSQKFWQWPHDNGRVVPSPSLSDSAKLHIRTRATRLTLVKGNTRFFFQWLTEVNVLPIEELIHIFSLRLRRHSIVIYSTHHNSCVTEKQQCAELSGE
ncbi:hypothetical protein MOQ_003593 [Trypanosoma cruzi marinkellei]|uniref:Uncharacterized protein n=1 Tax=Trypanosoma cruzi marinkellei TaxID=85056 RepID=K2NCH7_TRYCR|nr:hypothetical protein MOQ_003593 [Trypanosoma cruzi marinkellei]